MTHHLEVLLLTVLISFIGYSLLSGRIQKTLLTLPIIFVVIGLMLSAPLHLLGVVEETRSGVRLVAEITLVLVLFADASHIRYANLRDHVRLPARMLVAGMPLTIVLGTAFVYALVPGIGLPMALLTAAVLTPTDAALGQSVVSSPAVPPHLSQTINVESGLNDGLALPFVLLGAIMVSYGVDAEQTHGLGGQALRQVVLGPIIGGGIGWVVARLLDSAQERSMVEPSAQGVIFISTAFAAYLGSELLGGNGFIAAFISGMVFGNTYKRDVTFISEFMEGNGQILKMSAFLIFGGLMLPDGIAHITFTSVILSLGFLTFVRMLPIWLSLTGTGLSGAEKLFLGWFGPRGLASILFTLIMVDTYDIPMEDELMACVSITVFLSVMLHGLSAKPLSDRIGRKTG